MGTNDATAHELSRVPIPWVKHESRNAANPCIAQLIDLLGFEGYGRYWRLVELLSDSELHTVPLPGEYGYKRYQLGLRFSDSEQFASYLETLSTLDLVKPLDSGRYSVPIVEESAESIGKSRAAGRKGGRKAAENRRNRNTYGG